MATLREREVWEPAECPPEKKAVGSRWVFNLKTNTRGEVVRYKARLCAQGFAQKEGTDYEETYSPVVNFALIRMFVSIMVCHLGWKHRQLDIKCAYLYGDIDKEVYLRLPQGCPEEGGRIVRLKKALYGLHQSGRQWYLELNDGLMEKGFKRLEYTNCIYTLNDEAVMLVYVDDLVVFGKSNEAITEVIKRISTRFETVDLGPIGYLLGVQFEEEGGKVFMHQQKFINQLMTKYPNIPRMKTSTPTLVGTSITRRLDHEEELENATAYRSLVESLMFLASRTRPDITHAVVSLSQYNSSPGLRHWKMLMKTITYDAKQ